MTKARLRPYQAEAADAAVHHLHSPGAAVPGDGLRCQIIPATGSGKTRTVAVTAQRLHARRCSWSWARRWTS
jgi:superfamily II DNA or RNA helicase